MYWRYRFHICLAYFSGLCKGISPQFIWPYMVQYLQFRILKFPLNKDGSFQQATLDYKVYIYIINVVNPIHIAFGDGLHHPSMVIWGMVYIWVYEINRGIQEKLWISDIQSARHLHIGLHYLTLD